ncbi:hypothetical protein H5S09_03670 [Limosilactobacillus sp. STM2_1]|uniref:Uncharacterized protein n=2 Tax=Limosilactobacillus rudii TaxID=2759755 RepID=A0A7W3YN08_9LACO|nr:hypothetical protein [Limosilactobacillus rudii]MBB1097051.1 hypothetical protein [Limosilactobacillus rudii]
MMNNEELVQTARELAARLSNAEIDRASFKAQAIELTNENDQLKKQIEELKAKLPKEDDKKTDSQSQTDKPETKQDPQANK